MNTTQLNIETVPTVGYILDVFQCPLLCGFKPVSRSIFICQEKVEDTKGLIKSCKWKNR